MTCLLSDSTRIFPYDMATLKWRHLKLSVKELACHFCPSCQPVSLKLQERAYWLHVTKAAEAISAGNRAPLCSSLWMESNYVFIGSHVKQTSHWWEENCNCAHFAPSNLQVKMTNVRPSSNTYPSVKKLLVSNSGARPSYHIFCIIFLTPFNFGTLVGPLEELTHLLHRKGT